MCRLLECNKAYLEKTNKEELLAFLDVLEKSCGGHGNGIAFIDNGKVTFEFKSVTLTNKEIVDILYNKMTPLPEWFLYHTRVASAGSIKDENCHPYVNEDGTFALMMNGTDRTFGALGEERDITDTQVIYEIFEGLNYPIRSLTNYSPRFMGVKDGRVFATNPSGSYQSLKFIEKDGAICIASEFPDGYEGVKTMLGGFAWFEGDKFKEEIPKPKSFYSNIYDTDWWRKAYGQEVVQYSTYTGKGNSVVEAYEESESVDYPCANCKRPVEACNTCNFTEEVESEEVDLDELKSAIVRIKELNSKSSFTSVQKDIDEMFGVSINIGNDDYYVEVLDTKQVLIINQNGEIIEVE